MPWKFEELTGTKDGDNKDFTISFAAIPESMVISHQGTQLRRVVNQPQAEQFQFGVSGTAIKVGNAPESDEFIFARYFYEES